MVAENDPDTIWQTEIDDNVASWLALRERGYILCLERTELGARYSLETTSTSLPPFNNRQMSDDLRTSGLVAPKSAVSTSML